ncbi:unnamed protein product [Rotaria magnacalcarata]|uniref:Uncharacterized protein n=1 Tax=Rotaria magnacalcarata TaxID=392030 RepID=A0A816V2C5_9BILA|nr:unnamed protein product [Rotaria magnacalcarata]
MLKYIIHTGEMKLAATNRNENNKYEVRDSQTKNDRLFVFKTRNLLLTGDESIVSSNPSSTSFSSIHLNNPASSGRGTLNCIGSDG